MLCWRWAINLVATGSDGRDAVEPGAERFGHGYRTAMLVGESSMLQETLQKNLASPPQCVAACGDDHHGRGWQLSQATLRSCSRRCAVAAQGCPDAATIKLIRQSIQTRPRPLFFNSGSQHWITGFRTSRGDASSHAP
jgi:hypothetical protein